MGHNLKLSRYVFHSVKSQNFRHCSWLHSLPTFEGTNLHFPIDFFPHSTGRQVTAPYAKIILVKQSYRTNVHNSPKMCDREGRGPNLRLFLGKMVGLFLALWLTQVPLILLCARRDRGVLGNVKDQGPLLSPALVSGKAQGKDFTAVFLFLPFLSSCQNSGKQQKQCKHFHFLCKHVLFMGCRCQRSSWNSCCHASLSCCQWLWSWPVPPHCPWCATPRTRAVTRACCTRLFLVHVGVLLGKNPQVSPSEQASPVRSCTTEELHFFFNLSHKV